MTPSLLVNKPGPFREPALRVGCARGRGGSRAREHFRPPVHFSAGLNLRKEKPMSSFLVLGHDGLLTSRRSFLGVSGTALSATAVALLAGREVLAAADKAANPANDVSILNSALAAELEAIAAYGVGAGSGLLKGPVLALATTFQGHHKQHADVLAGAVGKLGGAPAAAKAKYD